MGAFIVIPCETNQQYYRKQCYGLSGFDESPQKVGDERPFQQHEGTLCISKMVGAPRLATCPPGMCQFTSEWGDATLMSRVQLTHDVIWLTFGLPDRTKPLGLSTCACLLAKINEDGSSEPIVRPYTPLSTNVLVGQFQLVVKVYEQGKMTQHMKKMDIGAKLEFKHIEKNVKIQYPFNKKNITMITGGTGITPMIQALNALLGNETDKTKVTLLFGNRTQDDILCNDLLNAWADDFKDRFKVVHVLSAEEKDSTWKGARGFINKELLEKHAPPSEDKDGSLVMVCGPPPMYNALCGPREDAEVTGILGEMGFTAPQVYKF